MSVSDEAFRGVRVRGCRFSLRFGKFLGLRIRDSKNGDCTKPDGLEFVRDRRPGIGERDSTYGQVGLPESKEKQHQPSQVASRTCTASVETSANTLKH